MVTTAPILSPWWRWVVSVGFLSGSWRAWRVLSVRPAIVGRFRSCGGWSSVMFLAGRTLMSYELT